MTTISTTTPGIAGREVSDTIRLANLFYAAYPPQDAKAFPVGINTNLVQGTVVGLDGSGNIVKAEQDGAPAAIGVLQQDIVTDGTTTTFVQVWIGGHFRLDALTFDASYTTDAQKLAAFGAIHQANIRISAFPVL